MKFQKYVLSTLLIVHSSPKTARDHAQTACGTPSHVIHCSTLILHEVDNLDTVKTAIKKYYYSGTWHKSYECLANKAKTILERYMPVCDKKLAVIFDIDDTLLSTWEINLLNDFGYIKNRNRSWEMEAKAPAIKPMLALYNFARENGFAVFLITGREEHQRKATIKNLHNAGFSGWKELYLKPHEYVGLPACMYKSRYREAIENMGYTIVANFGDQVSDMAGAAQAKHNFKVSNPVYRIP